MTFSSELFKRIFFGLLLAIVGFFIIYSGIKAFLYYAVILLSLVFTREYYFLAKNMGARLNVILLAIPIIAIWIVAVQELPVYRVLIISLLILILWLIVIFIFCLFLKRRNLFKFYLAAAFWYMFPSLLFFVACVFGRFYLIYLVLIVACSDTLAYFGGRLIGRIKLAPKISPNKTVEGSIVAIIGCGIISILINNYLQIIYNSFWIGILLSLSAQAGDLLESWVKRTAKVKDSGKILPGHGGAFDRFDGLLIAVIVAFILMIVDNPNLLNIRVGL